MGDTDNPLQPATITWQHYYFVCACVRKKNLAIIKLECTMTRCHRPCSCSQDAFQM